MKLGITSWDGLPPPNDLHMWEPAMRAHLAVESGRLRLSTAALSIRSGPANASAAAGALTSCSGNGRFDQYAGVCFCRFGFAGDACERVAPQQCNDPRPACVGSNKQVQQLIAGVDAPNCAEFTLMPSRCAGSCDVRQNRCVCGEHSRSHSRSPERCRERTRRSTSPV